MYAQRIVQVFEIMVCKDKVFHNKEYMLPKLIFMEKEISLDTIFDKDSKTALPSPMY